MLLFDKININDSIVIYDRTSDLNLICSLKNDKPNIVNMVIITVMKKRDFKPKSGTYKITV